MLKSPAQREGGGGVSKGDTEIYINDDFHAY